MSATSGLRSPPTAGFPASSAATQVAATQARTRRFLRIPEVMSAADQYLYLSLSQ